LGHHASSGVYSGYFQPFYAILKALKTKKILADYIRDLIMEIGAAYYPLPEMTDISFMRETNQQRNYTVIKHISYLKFKVLFNFFQYDFNLEKDCLAKYELYLRIKKDEKEKNEAAARIKQNQIKKTGVIYLIFFNAM